MNKEENQTDAYTRTPHHCRLHFNSTSMFYARKLISTDWISKQTFFGNPILSTSICCGFRGCSHALKQLRAATNEKKTFIGTKTGIYDWLIVLFATYFIQEEKCAFVHKHTSTYFRNNSVQCKQKQAKSFYSINDSSSYMFTSHPFCFRINWQIIEMLFLTALSLCVCALNAMAFPYWTHIFHGRTFFCSIAGLFASIYIYIYVFARLTHWFSCF